MRKSHSEIDRSRFLSRISSLAAAHLHLGLNLAAQGAGSLRVAWNLVVDQIACMGARQDPVFTRYLKDLALAHFHLQGGLQPVYRPQADKFELKLVPRQREPQYFEFRVPPAVFYDRPSPLDFCAQGWLVCVLTCPAAAKCKDLCERGHTDDNGRPVCGCDGSPESCGWETRTILGASQPTLLVFQQRVCKKKTCPGMAFGFVWPVHFQMLPACLYCSTDTSCLQGHPARCPLSAHRLWRQLLLTSDRPSSL